METSEKQTEDNSSSKPTGSLIQINSIWIELKIPKENNESKSCQHNFSIRGFAAEMRKKNPQASNPFASDGDQNAPEVELPPMHVPKYRWWRCPECCRAIENGDTEEIKVHSYCCHQGLASSSTSPNAHSNGDTVMELSERQQVPPAQRTEGIGCVDINAPPSGDIGPVEPDVTDKAGDAGDEETISKIGKTVTAGNKKGPSRQVNGDDDIPREFQQSTDDNTAEIPLDGKHNSADVKQRSRAGDGSHEEVDTAISVAPLQVEECEDTSSESDQDEKNENSRRKRKLRYMAELLLDKGNLRPNLPKEDDFYAVPFGSHTQSPRKKGKMLQEEPEGISDPGIVGTREGMSKADSERTLTDMAICSSEIQANASSRPSSGACLQIGNKNERTRRKTERNPTMVKQKNKQIQVAGRSSPRPAEHIASKNNRKEGDLRAPTANNLLRSSGISSRATETDNHSRNSESPVVPEEQIEATQTASQIPKFQSSNLKVGLDLSLDSFSEKIDPSTNKEKASTSGSVPEENEPELLGKKSQSWDLNEKIAQNSTNLVEERNVSLQKEPSCHKEKAHDVEESSKEINKCSDQVVGKKPGQGSSDDIPMEIVELMAKNQYERGLADAGNKFQQRSNDNMGRFPEVQGMGSLTQFAKGFSGLTSFSPANDARGVLTVRSADAAAAKRNSFNYSQMNRNHFEIVQPEKSKVSIYDIFPRQQMFSHGARYPASVRIGSQCSERGESLSSSRALNMSFGLGLQQKYPPRNPESLHRGRTISDIRADELKKTQENHIILSRSGSSELNTNPRGPVDPYSNESIPAMQLLSLMDGRSPGNTFNVDSSKPFAPCVYHPRYSTTERRDFLNGSLFQHQNGLVIGTSSVGESLGQNSGRHSFAFSGQTREQDQSHLAKYATSISYTSQSSSRAKDKQKATAAASDCIAYLQKNSERALVRVENGSVLEDVQPLGSIPPEEHNCITNRNPAEYFVPDTENPFTISWKDLKFPKNSVKRPRNAKPKARKEQSQNPSS